MQKYKEPVGLSLKTNQNGIKMGIELKGKQKC